LKLTAQEEYGLRCLLQVARRASCPTADPLSIRDVAAAEGLSIDYAAKLLRVLRQSGLLESERGAAGGYRLAAPAQTISLAAVMRALDSPLFSAEFCGTHTGQQATCVHHAGGCSMRALWRAIDAAVGDVLSRMTLADLLVDAVLLPRAPVELCAEGRGSHDA
jgi:Rrf2 family protein